jgi:hypothetical protein
MLKGVMKLVIIASFMVRVFPIRELKPGFIGGGNRDTRRKPQTIHKPLTIFFSIHVQFRFFFNQHKKKLIFVFPVMPK